MFYMHARSHPTRRSLQHLYTLSIPVTSELLHVCVLLPKSKSENRYSLMLRSYTTKYLEAIPLRSIDVEHIADEIVKVFMRLPVYV